MVRAVEREAATVGSLKATFAVLAMAAWPMAAAVAGDTKTTHLSDGSWQASDFSDPANPGCSMDASGSVPGSRLVMGASQRHPAPMSLVFRKPGWAIPAGATLPVRVSFKDDTAMEFTGHGDGQGVSADIDNSRLGPWVHNLTANLAMQVTFGTNGPAWHFDLGGTNKAMSAMGNCFAAHGIAGTGPPFSGMVPVRAPGLFDQHRVGTAYRGPAVMPDFDGRDRGFRDFRTRIRDGIRQGADFAGRYKVVEIGCGTDCRFDYVADVSTGQVHAFPSTSENLQMLSLEYRISSNLVRASWTPDLLRGERCLWQNFVFKDGVFTPLGKSAAGTCPLYD